MRPPVTPLLPGIERSGPEGDLRAAIELTDTVTTASPASDAFRRNPGKQPWAEEGGWRGRIRTAFNPRPKLDESEPASITQPATELEPEVARLLLKEAEELYAARLAQAWRAEARATTLQASAGIAIGLVLTGAAFLIDPSKVADRSWRLALTVVFALMLWCLGMAGYLASRATAKGQWYCVPKPEDVRKRASLTEANASRDRAMQLLRHYNCNFYFSHFKIRQVQVAGLWFRAALGCFAALSILLMIYAAVGPVPR